MDLLEMEDYTQKPDMAPGEDEPIANKESFLDDLAERMVKQVMPDIECYKLGDVTKQDQDDPQDDSPSEFCICGATIDDLDGENSIHLFVSMFEQRASAYVPI